jgi:hypothetical protein
MRCVLREKVDVCEGADRRMRKDVKELAAAPKTRRCNGAGRVVALDPGLPMSGDIDRADAETRELRSNEMPADNLSVSLNAEELNVCNRLDLDVNAASSVRSLNTDELRVGFCNKNLFFRKTKI